MTPRKKKKKSSLLTRLLGGGGAKGKKAKASTNGRSGKKGKTSSKAEEKAKPLSPLERSIQEIKHLANVGSKDPERLAMILSAMLGAEHEKTRREQEKFDAMIQDIVERGERRDSDSEE